MSLFVKRFLLMAGVGGLLATTGCDSNTYYDRPYDGYSHDGYRAADRDSAYERGYRDAERSTYSNRYDSRDYERGYERGKNEASRDARRHYEKPKAYRDPTYYGPPVGYEPPSGNGQPRGGQPSPGTFGVNDG